MEKSLSQNILDVFYSDISDEDQFYNKNPLLAHYTNLQNLENILRSEEVWFSNPLFMNDLEEVRFGIVQGMKYLLESEAVKSAFGSKNRYDLYEKDLLYYFKNFEEKHLIDTYVFCFSEHNPEEKDGRLSMWRGYGGQGNGAAIVFDSAKINKNENNPIQLAKVEYGSVTRRMEFIDKVSYIIKLIIEKMNITDEDIWQLSYGVFERLKTFALFTKHQGFSEEKEWRAVYFAERDQKGFFENMKHYHNGPRGVEPKLKLKIAPLDGVFDDNFFIREIISSIILGPSTSTPLAVRSVERMFDKLNHSELKDRLHPSSIPLRPIG